MLDLSFARHDKAHCLAPGLFRSLKKGERKKLTVHYRFNDNESITFLGPDQLGVDDLRVLQGIVALAGKDGLRLTPDPESDEGKEVRQLLSLTGDAAARTAALVQTSYRQLAREIGYKDPDDPRRIRDSIERLFAVTIFVQAGPDKERVGFRLLSAYRGSEAAAGLSIGINPRLAKAAMGVGQYVYIDLAEVRALSTDPARLMHQRLCSFINSGDTGQVGMDRLCSYIWPEEPEKTPTADAMKRRRQTARKALKELVGLGWTVVEYTRGSFRISRPDIVSGGVGKPP